MTEIVLRQGDGSPNDIRLYATPVAAVASTVIFLAALAGSPTDITLRDTTVAPGGGGGPFPTQYAGLRYFSGSVRELCMVAEADAPSGMGGVWKVRKGATTYVVYLVETTDPDASNVRVRTTTGTKAARLKT